MPLILVAGAIPQPSKMHKMVGIPGVRDINTISLKGRFYLKELLQISDHLSAGHLVVERVFSVYSL
jgi:hypothetical protein